ncbi:MAG: hypothetical protein DRO00_02030 [Thermoproteota archaeon]|nr:MAG: hypothetical protein DRO00_02030 [Candidatus Korarchaeota archaeon]
MARILDAPPMFLDLLPFMVKPDEVSILLGLSERKTVKELSSQLNQPLDFLKSRVQNLYRRGFLKKEVDGEVYYSVKSFRSVIDRHLAEGRTKNLKKYVGALAKYLMDTHVERAKENPYPGSKVLPIPQAIVEPVSIVIPFENAISIIEKADSISLRNCDCRMTFNNCNNPLRTCIALNEFSDELIDRGVAESISLEQAKEVLDEANRHGLVHQALYTDWVRGRFSIFVVAVPVVVCI